MLRIWRILPDNPASIALEPAIAKTCGGGESSAYTGVNDAAMRHGLQELMFTGALRKTTLLSPRERVRQAREQVSDREFQLSTTRLESQWRDVGVLIRSQSGHDDDCATNQPAPHEHIQKGLKPRHRYWSGAYDVLPEGGQRKSTSIDKP